MWADADEVGDLGEANWLPFAFELPPKLPRAFEGTYVAFRWRVEAHRPRLVGHSEASLPLIIREEQTIPTVRVKTSPNGTRRLLAWRSEAERTSHGLPCAVRYEERRPVDNPAPGRDARDDRRPASSLWKKLRQRCAQNVPLPREHGAARVGARSGPVAASATRR